MRKELYHCLNSMKFSRNDPLFYVLHLATFNVINKNIFLENYYKIKELLFFISFLNYLFYLF